MKENNVIREKSLEFSVNVVTLCRVLKEKKKEYIITSQLMRSATSVGANIEEAIGCQSKKDFYFRLTIAYKEARESKYWLTILTRTGLVPPENGTKLNDDCEELQRILGSILKTLRERDKL